MKTDKEGYDDGTDDKVLLKTGPLEEAVTDKRRDGQISAATIPEQHSVDLFVESFFLNLLFLSIDRMLTLLGPSISGPNYCAKPKISEVATMLQRKLPKHFVGVFY